MRKKKPLNLTISEEARRLLTLHAERSGASVSGLIERLIREEDARHAILQQQLERIDAEMARMTEKMYYEEKLPQRWGVGEKISEKDIATTTLGRVVTRSLDIDLATRSYHLNPPNTVAFIYHCDENNVIQRVESTQLREVPLKAVALSQ